MANSTLWPHESLHVYVITRTVQPYRHLLRPSGEHQAAVEVVVDRDGAVAARYLDAPARTPMTVLVDPQGIVSFVGHGFGSGDDATSTLIADWLADEAYRYTGPRTTGIWRGRRIPEVNLLLSGGRRVAVNSLSGPVAITAIDLDCLACEAHLNQLCSVMRDQPMVRSIVVVRNARQALLARASLDTWTEIGIEDGNALVDTFAPSVPVTLVLQDGRLVYLSGPRSELARMPGLLDLGLAASPGGRAD